MQIFRISHMQSFAIIYMRIFMIDCAQFHNQFHPQFKLVEQRVRLVSQLIIEFPVDVGEASKRPFIWGYPGSALKRTSNYSNRLWTKKNVWIARIERSDCNF